MKRRITKDYVDDSFRLFEEKFKREVNILIINKIFFKKILKLFNFLSFILFILIIIKKIKK